jgi:RNA polymerase sigma-70 factor (ECF subfamily)
MRVPVTPAAGADADVQALWEDLHTRLRQFVDRRVSDPFAADDLAQEILLRIHARIGDLRDGDRLDAWAYQVARNAIIDHYRARAAVREVPGGDALEDAAAPLPPELDADPGEAVRAEIARCLAPMVSRLPPLYREALELTDLGELTQAAAAERLELSVPGVKARVQRGREKLKDMLLACCEVATDSRGRPVEFRRQGPCGCAGDEPAGDTA